MSDEITLAEWTESPYSSWERRGHVVQHRVVVANYGGDGVDARHEVRSDDADNISSEWTAAEVVEARPHGLSKVKRGEKW